MQNYEKLFNIAKIIAGRILRAKQMHEEGSNDHMSQCEIIASTEVYITIS